MSRRLKQIAVVLVTVFVAAQLVRPDRTNPATDARRTIQARLGAAGGVAAILDRSCGDCHSSRTVWPWYTRIAPVSWAMAYGVKAGRKAVNFSEWSAYQPEEQQRLLAESCRDVSTGKMPGAWTLLHPEAKLSARDIESICGAARAGLTAVRGF